MVVVKAEMVNLSPILALALPSFKTSRREGTVKITTNWDTVYERSLLCSELGRRFLLRMDKRARIVRERGT